jgi:hypothetical protein
LQHRRWLRPQFRLWKRHRARLPRRRAPAPEIPTRSEKHGKGIVLMHDFQHPTSEALPELLSLLKGNGYTVVQMRAKEPVKTLAQYDEEVAKEMKLPTVSNRPTSSVVRTIRD